MSDDIAHNCSPPCEKTMFKINLAKCAFCSRINPSSYDVVPNNTHVARLHN